MGRPYDQLRSIWLWMLPRDSQAYAQMIEFRQSSPTNTIGEYAIMNSQEHDYFGSEDDGETPHYKFVDDFVERMRDALNETVETDPATSSSTLRTFVMIRPRQQPTT